MVLPGHLGAARSPAVVRLQNALNALEQAKRDPALFVPVNGVVGPRTAAAANRALGRYVVQGVGKVPQHWRGASMAIIAGSANDIASYIEQAAGGFAPSPPPAAPPSPPGDAMPYYSQPAAYYPQPAYGYGPQRPPFAPGGLPADHASLDVQAFIPAQYDHISLDPTTGLVILVGGLAAVLLISQYKSKRGA